MKSYGYCERASWRAYARRRQDEGIETYRADRVLHALPARFTGGISPIALSLAHIDRTSHLAAAAQYRMELSDSGDL